MIIMNGWLYRVLKNDLEGVKHSEIAHDFIKNFINYTFTIEEIVATDIMPIVYGLPSTELIEQADNGLCKIGGCIIDKDKKYYCKNCDNEF